MISVQKNMLMHCLVLLTGLMAEDDIDELDDCGVEALPKYPRICIFWEPLLGEGGSCIISDFRDTTSLYDCLTVMEQFGICWMSCDASS